MTKHQIRQKYKALRSEFSKNEIDEKSILIANQLLQLPIWDNTYFHLFLSIEEQKEVNTEFILHLLQGKNKEIVISKTNFETLEMTHFLLTENTKIKKNKYNIPEPMNGLEVPIEKIEVVFVPLLSFDKNGNRVGYGKGFYDKFLSKCHPKTIKIGLSFFEAEAAINGVLETDISLNYCVTPNTIYKF